MSTSEDPIIKLDGITKTYTTGELAVQVLKGVDLEIYPREYVALMGRSGAGKSTLMNILGCLDRPTSGAYLLAGQDVSSLEDDRLSIVRGKTIGFIFQSFHLLKDLNVRENVELPMEYQGVDVRERKERAESLLVRVGLGHRLDHYPRQLSGGERQRVAIARAMASEAPVLLADEPTASLDRAAADRLIDDLVTLARASGTTLIVVSHDTALISRMDRVLTIRDGGLAGDRKAAA